ncbi:MAG TPA: bifunctional phosphoribosylaminoimidazolecarboxamide formyltransferase/IMP cyclohydrolase [Candidatus Thalassarchaeaceae archaeon]|nr:bifunctional phosphoribosylaminoimidazolecarboxamide formyltransferase/IMP cyclohydrolase [Candidatus Thalassarchaeaceae archaeon]|tara:strand:+ start:11444 stop:13039 length:1596 start_codon:yes stop_codon:yes gene_type:complete
MAQPRALVSVWDKSGILEFASELVEMGWEIVSTGGTAKALRNSGLHVSEVSEHTGHPEIFDGRVKTLHPAVHGAILARRSSEDDMQTLDELGYGPIDLVCVNLYPFEETAATEPPVSDSVLIEMIDIGGPTMVRSAAKNHADVIIVTKPEQYEPISHALSETDGNPSGVDLDLRKELAVAAFQCTAAYDSAVSNELWSRLLDFSGGWRIPNRILTSSLEGRELRYGENPHQPASFFPASGIPTGLSAVVQHGGKPLSYNNYLDLDAALRLIRYVTSHTNDFASHSCLVIKHTNPCGVSVAESQVSAWKNALASDTESAFGCVIAFNQVVGKETAEAIGKHFFECMIAPGYESEALDLLAESKNRRMLSLDSGKYIEEPQIRQVQGGWLSQVQGPPRIDWENARSVTTRALDEEELKLARFGISVISEVKSNAIILVRKTETGYTTVGVGPGQTSRVEAVRIAARRAGDRAQGAMMISDAFFPFRDAIDISNEIGITSVVQPGGSIRDHEVIEAANEHGMAMVFTGTRLFRH